MSNVPPVPPIPPIAPPPTSGPSKLNRHRIEESIMLPDLTAAEIQQLSQDHLDVIIEGIMQMAGEHLTEWSGDTWHTWFFYRKMKALCGVGCLVIDIEPAPFNAYLVSIPSAGTETQYFTSRFLNQAICMATLYAVIQFEELTGESVTELVRNSKRSE